MRVQPLGPEDPPKEEMTTHSSILAYNTKNATILAYRIPWTEEPGGLQYTESQGVRQD